MTPEELMKPRYKVIADYPGCPHDIGYVFTDLENETLKKYYPSLRKAIYANLDKYPHLFQPLPWYAERKPEDMPEYLKNVKTGTICKAESYNMIYGSVFIEGDIFPESLVRYEPATHEQYINSKQQP